MKQQIKVILTKYALTSGPTVIRGLVDDENPGMINCTAEHGPCNYYHGKDWHVTIKSAVDDVIARHFRRKASLTKQLQILDRQLNKAIEAIRSFDFPAE